MPRIQPVDPANATPAVETLFAQVRLATGGVLPNFYRQAAVSPVVLESFLAVNAALGRGTLSAALREEIALGVAEANGCTYCLSAHSFVADSLELDAAERQRARRFESLDAKRSAGLRFAREVFEKHGHVSDNALAAVRAAGYTDAEVLEIVTVVTVNILTNYLNDVARVDVDFPVVESEKTAIAA